MTTKLTLSLDNKVIGRAKRIARRRGKSLSKMVEEYFNSIPENKMQEEYVVEQIGKRIKPYLEKMNLSEEIDYKNLIREWRYKDYIKKRTQPKK